MIPFIASVMSCELGAICMWYLERFAMLKGLGPICVVTKGILSIEVRASWVAIPGESTRREITLDSKSFIAVKRQKVYNKSCITVMTKTEPLTVRYKIVKNKLHQTSHCSIALN